MPNEADTCRRYVVPKLQAAGWDNEPYRINEQVTFTDGRIVVTGRTGRLRPGKRADYHLRLRPDFAIAVVEAKGTFHKPSLDYWSVGTKKLYRIEPGDLLFNNVFAWEGAIAVAQEDDTGRVGSHRFITCDPRDDVATADFLCFYFLTPEGLERIGKASPGGAGRNRTLGLDKLAAIEVPVPPIEHQRWFDRLQNKVRELRLVLSESETELDALMPAALDRAFGGALT